MKRLIRVSVYVLVLAFLACGNDELNPSETSIPKETYQRPIHTTQQREAELKRLYRLIENDISDTRFDKDARRAINRQTLVFILTELNRLESREIN